ncbi:F-box only protein 15-like isoform X1 [Heptranchias perlo]|uniref:F-box only protein 15-like isoform X1 n=1 Tax=Heptranchias perlo TaxID=212740 RepID=UPI0035597B38
MATGGGRAAGPPRNRGAGSRRGQLEAGSFGHKSAPWLPSKSYQLRGAKDGKWRYASLITIESLPWEILQRIFSYLDVSSLLCAGCVSKSFYQVSNDNLIWHRIYSSYFACKRKAWKPKAVDVATENLSRISIQDSSAGFWKKEYIRKCAGVGTRGVGQLLKPINRYTGLPSKFKEAVKALGITWMVVLRERNGKEHIQEQSKAYFSDTSVTLYWNGAVWPHLSNLKALAVYGVIPLFPPSKTPAMNGPRRRSLLAEYNLTTLEESSMYIGGDKLVKLQCLYPGMLLGCWQEDGELAVIVANLHFHQLIEKSTLGSATCLYSPPPHESVLDDVDPEYGLHGYHCHISLHSGKSSYMSGSFHSLFCRKDYIQNGFLRITVISSKKESQHSTISGNLYFPWDTEFLKGNVQHCCLMDVTVLDEAEKPFWCVSSPVAMHSVCSPAIRYSYLGKWQTIDYKDPEGKIHMELMWLEEEEQYYIVNLVLYLSVKKVNAWFATNY